MCIICVEIQRGALTSLEARRNFREMLGTDDIPEDHEIEVLDKISDLQKEESESNAELKGRKMTSEEFTSEVQKLQKSLWKESSDSSSPFRVWPQKGRVETSTVLRLAAAADKIGHPMKLHSVGNSGVALAFLTAPPVQGVPPKHMLSIADEHLSAGKGYRRGEDLVRIAIAIFEPIVQNERNLNRLDWYGLKRPPKGTEYWEY